MSRFASTASHHQSKQNLHPSSQQHYDQDEKENQSVLNQFDFAAIEEMDPSLGKLCSLMNPI